MEVLAGLLNSDDERVRASAAEHIIDRAIGRPVAMTADVTDRLDEFTDEQLDAGLAVIERQLGILATQDEGGESSKAVTH